MNDDFNSIEQDSLEDAKTKMKHALSKKQKLHSPINKTSSNKSPKKGAGQNTVVSSRIHRRKSGSA
jgi:hypothetical protein